MARKARLISEFQHIIMRGIGKQILFEDDQDRYYFLSLLERFKNDLNIVIMAYCIMENHVHLLIKDTDGIISLFMKKIGVCYARYYNQKYERVGHLFQDRYKSEIITDERYLFTAYRYILNNPEKAGIAPADLYPWSSYLDYGKTNRLTDTSLLAARIGSKAAFKSFMSEKDETECMENLSFKKDDEWALGIIRKTLNTSSGTILQKMAQDERDVALALLKSKGISIRQLERLTGINRGVIYKAGKR